MGRRKMTDPKSRRVVTRHAEEAFQFSCEKIAYWFFRLNGCLNLTNFLVHHERKDREGTEVDVLGVRFPYRNELALSGRSMDDHEIFTEREQKIDIIVADATTGDCKVNDSWIKPEKLNMERILFALGIFPKKRAEAIAVKLYEELYYDDDPAFRVNIYALGRKKNADLPPVVLQLTWEEVLLFIHHRFVTFDDYKRQHDQWDTTGKELFERATHSWREPKQFISDVISHLTN